MTLPNVPLICLVPWLVAAVPAWAHDGAPPAGQAPVRHAAAQAIALPEEARGADVADGVAVAGDPVPADDATVVADAVASDAEDAEADVEAVAARDATADGDPRGDAALLPGASPATAQVAGGLAPLHGEPEGDGRFPAEAVPASAHAEQVLETLAGVIGHEPPEAPPAHAERVLDALAAVRQGAQAPARDAAPRRPAGFDLAAAQPLDEARLDRVRGGFSGDGLQISFGVERAVYINGAFVASTTFNLDAAGRGGPGGLPAPIAPGVLAVQTGTGNSVVMGGTAGAAATVVQNTLDGQKIQSLTVVNATVNSLHVMRAQQLNAVITNALAASLRR